MNKLTEEMAVLSTIQKKNLEKLSEIAIYCIVEDVKEATLDNNDLVKIDIGIGELLINSKDNTLKFKFIPGAKLVDECVNAIKHKQNLLDLALESSLIEKVENLQKEVL